MNRKNAVAIVMGGISSALWGIIAVIKYKGYHLRDIIKDFLM